MASDEIYKKQLGLKLNRDKIKLWEPPYTNKDGSQGTIPQEKLRQYGNELNLEENMVSNLLEVLRTHALQKLAEREKFQSSGMATLKLKMTGQNKAKSTSVEVELSSLGSRLRSVVGEHLSQNPNYLKLICLGKVITDTATLQQQNIKNGSQIMVLSLGLSETEAQTQDQMSLQLQQTRHAAELLSARAANDMDIEGIDVQIADQSGKPIQLPAEEKKALTLAMTLHEKGRQSLKNKNVTLALPLLLDADKEFRQCRASILESVDNYAVLCLDIVWCYLCLKNVEDLPDAEERLKSSETFFHKSYGSDLERLIAVKGSSGEELALFMRLHLLQGIVAFHQHKIELASNLLAKAESELNRLQIDGDSLTAVMTMGFNEGESRLGLRACNGDVQNAVTHIMKRREEKKENAKKVKEERRRNRLAKHIGKTANGQSINIANYEMLLGMGFPKGASAEAMRQSNNDVSLALEVLQNHPEFLDLPDPEPKPKMSISDDMIAQVTAMGFDPEMCHRALQQFSGDISRSIEELIRAGGIIPAKPDSPSPSTSSGSSASTPSEERLRSSETFFHKSYGSELERLIAVKGSSGEELALFMRLHLLQGIVAFHQSKIELASNLLAKAESELNRLQIDEDSLTAEERLRSSETFFHKSYGSDLERLIAVKGSSGEELALFMRLHLLQGIVAFHQHKIELASNLLSKAESELNRLQIDGDKLTAVMTMGFNEGESRLGLRACSGDVQNAVTHIMKRREEKKENAKKVKEERRRNRLAKHIGKTANGQSINISNYEMLLGMGFPKGASAEAMRQSNNDVSLALEVLQNHPEFLDLPDPEPKPKLSISDDMIAQVTAMGFDPEMCHRALQQFSGDISRSIEELIRAGGIIPAQLDSPSTSSGSSASTPSGSSPTKKTAAELLEDQVAIDKLVSDIPTEEEDYLNITLDDEQQFLLEYKSLIQSLSK